VLVKILSRRPECPQWDSSWSSSVPHVKFRDSKISSSRPWPSLPTDISIHYSLPSDHSTPHIIVELPWENVLSYETLLKYLYFDRYRSPDILSLRSCFSIHFHVHWVNRIKTVMVEHSSRYTTYKRHLWIDTECVNYGEWDYKSSPRNFNVFWLVIT